MKNQHTRDTQVGFLQRCAECYNLVQNFLHDRVPTTINGTMETSTNHKQYQFDKDLRESVKQKVILSIDKLEESIDLHGYVLSTSCCCFFDILCFSISLDWY